MILGEKMLNIHTSCSEFSIHEYGYTTKQLLMESSENIIIYYVRLVNMLIISKTLPDRLGLQELLIDMIRLAIFQNNLSASSDKIFFFPTRIFNLYTLFEFDW